MAKDNLIFFHKFFKSIADCIVKIFLPLYILTTTNNISLSFLYLLAYSFFVFIFMFLFKRFIQKFGVLAIMLHFIPIIATECVLSLCSINWGIILLVSCFMALAQTLYSIPFNLIFAISDKNANVAKFKIATNIGKLVFIICSGFFLASSFEYAFIIVSVVSCLFYLGSIIPIFNARNELRKIYAESANYENQSKKMLPSFKIFHICFGIVQVLIENVVPLFLYINNLTFEAITIYLAIVEVGKVLTNLFSAFLIKKGWYLASSIITFCLFLCGVVSIIFIKNNITLYIVCTFLSLAFSMLFATMFNYYCKLSIKNNTIVRDITNRDIEIFSMRPYYYATFYLSAGFYPCFGLGIFAVIVMFICQISILKGKEN